MANLNVKLVKSLNGPITIRPAARSPRSATCCRSPKKSKEELSNEVT